MTGIYGDYGKFNNIFQSNGKKDVERKNLEKQKANEPIEFKNADNADKNKELGFDALDTSGSIYGKALTLSSNYFVDSNLTKGLSPKEQEALKREVNKPGVVSRVGNSAVNIFAAIEGIDEFA